MNRRKFLIGGGIAIGTAVMVGNPPRRVPRTHRPSFTLWVFGGADRIDVFRDVFAKVYPRHAARLTVNIESAGAHAAEVLQSLRLALASRANIPDLVMMNYRSVPEFAQAGMLEDLTDRLAPYLNDMSAAGRQLATYGGRLFAIPSETKSKVWYFRRDLFEAAGLSPNSIHSFQDLLDAAVRYREAVPTSYLINMGRSPIHYWYELLLSHWDDLRFADSNGRFLMREDDRFATVLKHTKSLFDSPAGLSVDDWAPDWQPAIAAGTVGASLSASWLNQFLPSFAPHQARRWGMTLWPGFSRNGSQGGAVFAIPKLAKNKNAAFEWMAKYRLTRRAAVEDWKVRGVPPVIRSAIDEIRERTQVVARPPGISDLQWRVAPANFFGPGYMDPVFESLKSFQIFSYDPAADAELQIFRRHGESYVSGKQSLRDALTNMENDMTRQIRNPYR